jgi:biopolymer transport protein ExbB
MRTYTKTTRTALTLGAALSLAALSTQAQSFSSVQTQASEKLENALAEFGALQESISTEKVPLATKLNGLESEVTELKDELKRLERLRDSRDLNLSALEAEVKARRDEMDYAKNLLVEFVNNQSASADASERQLYEAEFLEVLNAADAPSEGDAGAVAAIESLIKGVELGVTRLNTLVGGHSFEGKAVMPTGNFETGKFLIFGPVVFFSADNQSDAGITLQGDSGEPALISLNKSFSGMPEAILAGGGMLPLDPTLGKALALETTKDSLIEHIKKGGFWIYPILTIAFISLIIGIFKLFELSGVKRIPKGTLIEVLNAIQEGDQKKALEKANSMSGAAQDIVVAGVKNIGHGRDLIEQSMEEVLMRLQPKLERLISIVWITAATAPLLGLLGTVTGIITTFKLLTIFGSGDPKALGGGISEALITTEFGLIVAIPSLILHAFLQRRAKAIENEFEGDAMTLLNGILRAEKK